MTDVIRYKSIPAATLLLILLAVSGRPLAAQQSDTTDTTRQVDLNRRSFPQSYHSERSANSYLLSESGSYNVPEPTRYYQPPFNGQESLDKAVEAYREELKNDLANSPLFRIIGKIAPFINNTFEFGFYRIYDIPIIERDHPNFYPQTGPADEN